MNKTQLLEKWAIEAILNGATWIPESRVSEKFKGQVFAIELSGVRMCPDYQFEKGRLLPVVKKILKLFKGRSEISIAAWFNTTSSFLAGMPPRLLLTVDPKAVLQAAEKFINCDQLEQQNYDCIFNLKISVGKVVNISVMTQEGDEIADDKKEIIRTAIDNIESNNLKLLLIQRMH